MQDLITLAADLQRRGEAFALATVVRCERPTSAKPGAKALIRPDGSVTGWVGGACAEPVVTREALIALADGLPRLVVLVGEGGRDPSRTEGIVHLPMTCHSGGTMEIYVEPFVPKPLLVLVGHGPVIETLATLGESTGYSVTVLAPGGYVSLVASRKRAGTIVDTLKGRGVPAAHLDRLKAPAGIDIGAVTPEEIAVSILAEVIHSYRSRKMEPVEKGGSLPLIASEGKDPICGMTVKVATARHTSQWAGRAVYFCCARCKETFDADPARYAAALAR